MSDYGRSSGFGEAYARFLRSMEIDYGSWRDGEPYDLDALDAMDGDERIRIELKLASKATLDWRDVDALLRLGTASALERVARARAEQGGDAGAHAFRAVSGGGWGADEEAELLRRFARSRHMDGAWDALVETAEAHPTPSLMAGLLRLAGEGHRDVRYSAGALLLYLKGLEPTWYGLEAENRPHLLGLIDGDPATRRAARDWLAGRCGLGEA